MRKRLKEFDWHVYGVSDSDLKYITQTVYSIIDDREKVIAQEIEKIHHDYPDDAEDILDDFVYYKRIECYYLMELLIIRLIGIFEGIIEKKYLPVGRYFGYTSRIRKLKQQGFSLQNEKQIEEWANLRNALAHSPSEQYRPNTITREDIDELSSLLLDALDDLKKQNKQ